jgi:DNA invertase Pin-like site-specific DNA recombinase
MSTDYRRYSPENQKQVMADYAASKNIHIARTYEDSGKSGLTLRERPALAKLLRDVGDLNRDFGTLLVYDISRWGRFQDVDESAYYEYVCRRAGVQVVYCAEPFDNDGSPSSSILKTLKRAMAGEYSRELSSKVFLGQCRGTRAGFHQGAFPGYGLRRVLVDKDGSLKGPLQRWERKSIQSDHVVIVPGPANEVALIRRIYGWFLEENISASHIAKRLNSFGVPTDLNRRWTKDAILRILTSEKYVGNNVYNRTSGKLHTPRVANPRDEWIRAVGSFEPIIDTASFEAVKVRLSERTQLLSDERLLEKLSDLRDKEGTLSALSIGAARDLPSQNIYKKRFGSLTQAYKAIGFDTKRNYEFLKVRQSASVLTRRFCEVVFEELVGTGCNVECSRDKSILHVNGELRIKLTVRPASRTIYARERWIFEWPRLFPLDVLILARADRLATELIDFYMLPRGCLGSQHLTILQQALNPTLEMFRFSNLKVLLDLVARSPLEMFYASGTGNTTRTKHRHQQHQNIEPACAEPTKASGNRQ